MNQESRYLWIAKRKNERDGKQFCRLHPVLSHPLKVIYTTKHDTVDKSTPYSADTKTVNRSARSSTSDSTASLTKGDDKANIKRSKEAQKFIDPLGATLEGTTLNGHDSDLLTLKPAKRNLKQHDFDKIAKGPFTYDTSNVQHKKYEFDDFEPWLSKKAEILKKFVTNEKRSIVTSFLPGGVPVHSQVAVSDVRLRLEQLDSFQDASTPKRIQNLSQKDYIEKINELIKALIKAWLDDQRVQAIKIVIQCAKFLADTSSVSWFYPSQVVLVVDVLDTFGRLVYERLEQKVLEEGGLDAKSQLDWATLREVPQGAKEIARNWFYKIASIRELLPRFYVEVALLPVYRFIDVVEIQRSISRLVQTCRGLADPLASFYARCYLLKTALAVEPTFSDPAWRCFHDCLTLLWPVVKKCDNSVVDRSLKDRIDGESAWQTSTAGSANVGGSIATSINKSVTSAIPTASPFELMDEARRELYSPAFEFIADCVLRGSSRQDHMAVLGCCEQRRDPMLTCCTLRAMSREYVAEIVQECIRVVKECYAISVEKAQHGTQSEASRLVRCRWTSEALRIIGEAVCDAEPPPHVVQAALKDAWRMYRRFAQLRIEMYVDCASTWLRFAMRHFGTREIDALLGELIPSIRIDRLYERRYDMLIDVLKDMAQFMVPKIGLGALMSMQNFTAFLDLFERSDIKASTAEILLNYFCMYGRPVDFDDPSLTNHCLNLCSAFFQSLDFTSPVDEQRRVAQKIFRALQNFWVESGDNLHEEIERQLTFCVEVRGRFCRMSHAGDVLMTHLSHAVNRLCVRLAALKLESYYGNRNASAPSLDDLVRSCLAFVFVTAPSISDYFVRINLYLEAACVAAMNECTSHRDAFLRIIISMLAERPPQLSGKSGSYCDVKLRYTCSVANVLSLLFYITEDESDRPPLYYFRALLTAVRRQNWKDEELEYNARVLLSCLSFLATSVQSRYDYDNIDPEDQFTISCARLGGEIISEMLECLQTLLLKHDEKESIKSAVPLSQRRAGVNGPLTLQKTGSQLCADLADLIISKCDLHASGRFVDLVASLWIQGRKVDVGRILDGRLKATVQRLKRLAVDDPVYGKMYQEQRLNRGNLSDTRRDGSKMDISQYAIRLLRNAKKMKKTVKTGLI